MGGGGGGTMLNLLTALKSFRGMGKSDLVVECIIIGGGGGWVLGMIFY